MGRRFYSERNNNPTNLKEQNEKQDTIIEKNDTQWEKHYDEKSGRFYYVNKKLNTSVWEDQYLATYAT